MDTFEDRLFFGSIIFVVVLFSFLGVVAVKASAEKRLACERIAIVLSAERIPDLMRVCK